MLLSYLVRFLSQPLCFVLIFGITSCASVSDQNMPEEDSAELVLVKKKCTICHGLPHPKRHTASQWDPLLVWMTEIMTERKITYTADEINQIKSYLQRNAR